ncbi:MAG: T9SS type A sorting domain-containing protein [Bacteroidota bacterium]
MTRKTLLYPLMILLQFTSGYTQIIDSIRFLPAIATSSDSVHLMVRCSWPCCGPLAIMSHDVQITPSESYVGIDVCYYIGPQDTSGGTKDTLSVGLFPQGRYRLMLRVFGGEWAPPFPFPCSPNARDSLSTFFEVDFANQVKEPPQSFITLSPNPAPGAFTLSYTQVDIQSLALYDLTGRRIPAEINHAPFKIQVRSQYQGIAIVKVETNQGQWVQKVQLE